MSIPHAAVIAAGSVVQSISREIYRGTALHFGRSAANRYDDPAQMFGVLYLASELSTGLMETAFRNHQWWRSGAKRAITLPEVYSHMVRIVRVTHDLSLCDLVSPNAALQAYGLNAVQLAVRNYRSSRVLAARIERFRSPAEDSFDGILYPSRNNPGARCIALFDRAQTKVVLEDDVALVDHAHWPTFIREFDVVILPEPRK